MNAIVSLSHFCEVHGPSVMFCTQAFHPDDEEQDGKVDSGGTAGDSTMASASGWSFRGKYRASSLASSEAGFPSASAPATPTGSKHTVDFCEACRSATSGQQGFISKDVDAKVSYMSSQHPHHPQVYSMLRQACIRALSCEVCPGREGPIFFGDDSSGHVFSYTFFIRDSQARGFQRSYSIMVVMMDKIYLLNSWPFLVSSVTSIISRLQDKATKVYEAEQARTPTANMRRPILTHHQPLLFRRQTRGPIKPARSIVELTSDRHVFRELHTAFCCILRVGGTRLREKLLEGPPTEDSIIDVENSETEEAEDDGFVMIFDTPKSPPAADDVEATKRDSGVEVQRRSVTDSQSSLYPVLDLQPLEASGCGEDTGRGDDTTEDEEQVLKFTSLRVLLKVLGEHDFHTLAHHVVVGNQVVVRSQHQTTATSVIDILKSLLPLGCCKVVPWATTYMDTWRCNFLGLPCGTVIPQHVGLYVCVDIIEPDTSTDGDFAAPRSGLFDGYTIMVHSPTQLPQRAPTVLQKMVTALLNTNLTDSVVDHCLVCLKEEWMNKVKVRFMYTKAGGHTTDSDMKKLLPVIGAGQQDLPVLTFWMTGLSNQYRTHMLSTALAR